MSTCKRALCAVVHGGRAYTEKFKNCGYLFKRRWMGRCILIYPAKLLGQRLAMVPPVQGLEEHTSLFTQAVKLKWGYYRIFTAHELNKVGSKMKSMCTHSTHELQWVLREYIVCKVALCSWFISNIWTFVKYGIFSNRNPVNTEILWIEILWIEILWTQIHINLEQYGVRTKLGDP